MNVGACADLTLLVGYMLFKNLAISTNDLVSEDAITRSPFVF